MANHKYLASPPNITGMPPGVPYIIGNEAAERFSYYGMKSILTVFMAHYILNNSGVLAPMPPNEAYKYSHYFVTGVYFLPILGAIIADGLLVDPKLGTGAVKVTPAHDPNDYACGLRHNLPTINILNPDGTINSNGGPYAGLTIAKAREQVVADMEKLGLFDGREDRDIDLAHSDRSKTPIEPYLSDQWFVLMKDRDGKPGLAQMAIDAVKEAA